MVGQAEELTDVVETHGYRRLIFDLDCTLTRLVLPWPDWIAAIVAELQPTARGRLEAIMSTPGAAWGDALNEQIELGDISPQRVIDITRTFEGVDVAHVPNWPLVEAAAAMASAGRELFLWSNNMHSTCDQVLREVGIHSCFGRIVGRDDVRFGKPHPEGWELISDHRDPTTYLLIGDSDNDKRGALLANIPYFAVQFPIPERDVRLGDSSAETISGTARLGVVNFPKTRKQGDPE